MTEPDLRAPFTIPLAAGPAGAWLDRGAALLCVASVAGLAVLLWPLQPAVAGYDTHTQLGWAPCSWPVTMGMPCPTCGCTTAACLLLHGQPLQALAVQPFGAILGLLAAGLAGHALYCLLRQRSFLDLAVRLPLGRLLLLLLLLLLGSWAYKCAVFQA